jgi:hypothetical protein
VPQTQELAMALVVAVDLQETLQQVEMELLA